MDWKLEVITIPVSDVDRAKEFYAEKLGFNVDVDHRDGVFYIHTNKDAPNYKLVTAPVGDPSPKGWTELIPHRSDVLLNRHEVFAVVK